MEVVYDLDDGQIRELHQLYQNEWWTEGRSLNETRAGVDGSQICIGMVDSFGRLQGFARVLTDYIFKALVFDVIVAEGYRGRGLGKQLMQVILEHEQLKRVRSFELYCLPELCGFYKSFGFSSDVGGIKLMRHTNAQY